MGGRALASVRLTVDEYLRLERDSETKHEYVDGEVIDMAGASVEHTIIGANVIGALGNTLRGGSCRVHTGDLRVRIPRRARYRYPDASVTCGEVRYDFEDRARLSVLNPVVVVEVLSPSTGATDMTTKATEYSSIDSMRAYLVVEQARPEVRAYLPAGAGGRWDWSEPHAGLDAVVPIDALGIELRLSELYAGVAFVADDAP